MCLLTIVTISFSNASEAFDMVYFLLGLILYCFHDVFQLTIHSLTYFEKDISGDVCTFA
jgi:hypothetical protein